MGAEASTRIPAEAEQAAGLRRMVAGGLLLGTIGVFVQEAGVDPLTAVAFRCAFGALALLAWAAATSRLAALRADRGAIGVAAGTAVLMLANWGLFFAAIDASSIAIATIAFHVQPLWVMAAGIAWFGERATARRLVAAAIALAGLALACGLADGALDGASGAGVGLAVAASLSYAAVTLIAQRQRRLSPLALAFWQCAIGAVATLGWPAIRGWPDAGALGWLAGLGAIHSALAYVLLYEGMRRLPAGRVAVLQFVYPAAAIALDVLVYGRVLGPFAWVGVAAMAIGLWLAGAEPGARPRAGGDRMPERAAPGLSPRAAPAASSAPPAAPARSSPRSGPPAAR